MTLADQINRVLRRVVSTGDRHTVVVEQRFPAGVDQLWSACTEPQRLARWFEPVDGDLTASGRYRLRDSGTEGTIEHCEPPTALRITWEYGGDTSLVTVTLTPAGPDATVLRLEHGAAPGEYWDQYGPAAGGAGWDESLLALWLHLDGDPRATPAELQGVLATAEGREWTAGVVDAWRAAHIESGADPAEAEAAATRSLSFYAAG